MSIGLMVQLLTSKLSIEGSGAANAGRTAAAKTTSTAVIEKPFIMLKNLDGYVGSL